MNRRQKIQPRAKTKFGDGKAVAKPVGQIVSGQKNIARFSQPVFKAEIRVIKPRRDRNTVIAPLDLCVCVLHYGGSGYSRG